MTNADVHDIIVDVVAKAAVDLDVDGAETVAHAVVGALATNGYAIVKIDPEALRRVLAETAQGKR